MQPDGQSLFATCYMIYSRNLFGPLEKFFGPWETLQISNMNDFWQKPFLSMLVFVLYIFCCKSRTALNKCQSFEKFIFNLSCLMESIRILTEGRIIAEEESISKMSFLLKMWNVKAIWNKRPFYLRLLCHKN